MADVDGPPPLNPIIGNFRTSDDQFISLCMLQGFHYWPEVARVLNHPEWITDPRFASYENLQANSGDARELVVGEFAKDTFDSWLLRLRGRAPLFNQNGDEILTRELGLDETAIVDLKIAGVVS